ncbi:hypothetical protein GCM10027578_37390 [Spirosoma luteolum]
MKTDRFADSIRRKLDSIRPEFAERDWVRMQAMLKQVPPLPNAPSPMAGTSFVVRHAARLVAAGVTGTVLFLTTTLYQTYEVNRLRNQLQSTTQTAPSADSIQAPGTDLARQPASASTENPTAAPQTRDRDTVYITRYLPAPAGPAADQWVPEDPTVETEAGRSARQLAGAPASRGNRQRNDLDGQQTRSTSSGVRGLPTPGQPASGMTPTHQPELPERAGESGIIPANRVAGNRSRQPGSDDDRAAADAANPVARRTDHAGDAADATLELPSSPASMPDRRTTARDLPPAGNRYPEPKDRAGQTATVPTGRRPRSGRNRQANPVINGSEQIDNRETGADAAVAGLAPVVVEPLAVRPIETQPIDWEQHLIYRSRLMRPARTVQPTVAIANNSPTTKATKPERQPVDHSTRVRIGGTAEVGRKFWQGGAFTELLVGRHLQFSLGLTQGQAVAGNFLTDDEYDRKTRENFRREFARNIDPRHDILNIQLKTLRVQMPVAIGYRFSLGGSWSVVPTVGTYLNLTNQKQITFSYRQPPVGFETGNLVFNRPVRLVDALTTGAGVEWQSAHWGVQATPLLSFSLYDEIVPPGMETNSVKAAFRLRAFYQF